MADNRVGRILLLGEGSARFAASLFRPSKDEVAQHEKQMNEINDNISVRYDGTGFDAVIKNLDLSFIRHNKENCCEDAIDGELIKNQESKAFPI